MALLQRLGIVVLVWALACISLSDMALPGKTHFAFATAIQVARTPRDGRHDFDFTLGTWRTDISRLEHPLTGSTTWVQLHGTKVVRRVWGGRASLEEIEADSPAGHREGITLFLYNPQSHQWSLNFANSRDGTFSQPAIGEFKNGRGEFFDQKAFNRRAIFVRIIWSDITPNSHCFEQSFSNDGGKTWEPNFVAILRREEGIQPTAAARGTEPAQHDFDFEIGTWKSHISRRLHPLTGSNTWIQMEATVVFRKIWIGRANLMELQAAGPNGHLKELNLRLYNPQSHQWTFNFANSSDGTMSKPMVGEFRDGRGEFVGQDSLNGRIILVRHVFSDITPDSHHFEQSFSDDGGKTWEPNFVATLTRVKEEGSAATN